MKAIAIACLMVASVPAFAEESTKVKTDVKTEIKNSENESGLKVERKKVTDRPGPFNDSNEASSTSMAMEKDSHGNQTLKQETRTEVDNPGVANDHKSVHKTKVVRDSKGKVLDVEKSTESH